MNIPGSNGNPMMQMGGGLPPPPPFPEMNVYGQELMNISDAQRMAAYMPNNMMMGPGSMVRERESHPNHVMCVCMERGRRGP